MTKNMIKKIDDFLNGITMYRLVLYYLTALWVYAFALSVFGRLAFSPLALLFSSLIVVSVSWAANKLFAGVYSAPANVESVYITALILILIITPLESSSYLSYLVFMGWAAVWAMASKYIFAIRKKHIFNPAAFAVALLALTVGQGASWWVGSLSMLPIVLIGGILLVRKLKRYDLVFSFIFSAIVVIAASSVLRGLDPINAAITALLNSPLLFFAFVMITEPLTTPPANKMQICYGALTGFLFLPQMHLGGIYSTPELALLVGNIFSYAVSPKEKLLLTLKEKIQLAKNTFDFSFVADQSMDFSPGQYLEWTMPHERPDDRGNRRYFTISSSPTEKEIKMGVKFYAQPSSFKKGLLAMKVGQSMVASQLAGEFILPKDKDQKLVFIAGGIGVTPFRSMLKYLIDKDEKRDIAVFYANNTAEEIAYKDIFEQAKSHLGIKTIFCLTNNEKVPADWAGHCGRIDQALIKKEIPDFSERTFYISGPRSMILAYQDVLKKLGVQEKQIITDFFPGFA